MLPCAQIREAVDTYKSTAPSNSPLSNIYEKERCGWAAYARSHSNLLWNLVPPNMSRCVQCIANSTSALGDPDAHVFRRDHATAIAARTAWTPPPEMPPTLVPAGFGSPRSFKRRRE